MAEFHFSQSEAHEMRNNILVSFYFRKRNYIKQIFPSHVFALYLDSRVCSDANEINSNLRNAGKTKGIEFSFTNDSQ